LSYSPKLKESIPTFPIYLLCLLEYDMFFNNWIKFFKLNPFWVEFFTLSQCVTITCPCSTFDMDNCSFTISSHYD